MPNELKDSTTATHSPAPWEHVTQGPWILDAAGATVATLANYSLRPPAADANGRLIAASPELLSALRLLVTYLRRREHWPVESEHMAYLADAEAAIAKAEGR